MDIAEKIMSIKSEIINEVKDENEKEVTEKREELKDEYKNFQKEIKEEQNDIINSYKNKAEQKSEEIISKAILERKKKKRTKLEECRVNFLKELEDKLDKFTEKREYALYLLDLIKSAVAEFEDNEFLILMREKDSSIVEVLKDLVKDEINDANFEFQLTSNIKSGGFIIQSKNSAQLMENTFSTLISIYEEEIAIELQKKLL